MLRWNNSRGGGLEGMVLTVDFKLLAVYFWPKADVRYNILISNVGTYSGATFVVSR